MIEPRLIYYQAYPFHFNLTIVKPKKVLFIMNNISFQAFEVTTNIEGSISKDLIDVNADESIIHAIDVFKRLYPTKSQHITDVQLVTGAGRDDLTLLLIGDKKENIAKAFKIAYNLLSREQRYSFNRTPDVLSMIKHSSSGNKVKL